MLRPLALVTVRQHADEARHAQPLALARRDELVEYDLRAVGEIAELRLPHRERIGLGERIAVLEAQHRLLRQHRVDDLVAPLAVVDVIERRVAVLVFLVDQHRMTLRERAALGILTGELYRMAFAQQRAESERLAGRPVDALAGVDRLGAGGEEALDGAVDVEALRHRGDLLSALAQLLDRKAGVAAARIIRRLRDLEAGPAPV